MEQISELSGFIAPYLGTIFTIIGIFSAIAKWTPTPVDNVVAVILKQIVNFLALNTGNAENAAIPGDKKSVEETKARQKRRAYERRKHKRK